MKNQTKETEVNEREYTEMNDRTAISMELNTDPKDMPCAICGDKCEPVGLDFFVIGTKQLVCDICAQENDDSYEYRIEAFRYANLRGRWMLENIRRKIQEVVDEPVEKRILKLLDEMFDKELQQVL